MFFFDAEGRCLKLWFLCFLTKCYV